MSLLVREAGLYSLLVDFGRPQSRALGLPVGGAADRSALVLGNALVGNRPDALALEVTLAGPTLEALHPVAAVVFGAPFACAINGSPVAAGTTFTLEAGDALKIGGTGSQARAYLCVAGGFASLALLGSSSALEPIRAGDTIVASAARIEPRALPFCTGDGQNPEAGDLRARPRLLRVIPGPQHDWFSGDAFFEQTYMIAPASNRMGLRLLGEPLTRRPGELVSEAVAPGAVQVTNDGLPIVLGVDGQTIGGYPKIAHVIRADLDQLGQLRPGDRVKFAHVSLEIAHEAARRRTTLLKTWSRRLSASARAPQYSPEN
jgi:antagonist of KipI